MVSNSGNIFYLAGQWHLLINCCKFPLCWVSIYLLGNQKATIFKVLHSQLAAFQMCSLWNGFETPLCSKTNVNCWHTDDTAHPAFLWKSKINYFSFHKMNHQDVNLSRIFSGLNRNIKLVNVFPEVIFTIHIFCGLIHLVSHTLNYFNNLVIDL